LNSIIFFHHIYLTLQIDGINSSKKSISLHVFNLLAYTCHNYKNDKYGQVKYKMNKKHSVSRDIYTPTTPKEVKDVENLLLKYFGTQMRDVWTLGLLLGLRIDELLHLKFEDLRQKDDLEVLSYRPLKSLSHEQRGIVLGREEAEIIKNIRKEFPTDVYLFQSRSSRNRVNKEPAPISRQVVFKAFKDVGDMMSKNLTVHSMRHALAVNIIRSSKDLSEYASARFTNEVISQYHYKKKK
jgi:integrase